MRTSHVIGPLSGRRGHAQEALLGRIHPLLLRGGIVSLRSDADGLGEAARADEH